MKRRYHHQTNNNDHESHVFLIHHRLIYVSYWDVWSVNMYIIIHNITNTSSILFWFGSFGNMWCPDSSIKSHPFSVTHVPGQTDRLRIIFPCRGLLLDRFIGIYYLLFLSLLLLARSLIWLPFPNCQQEYLPFLVPKNMLDGWHGPKHLVGVDVLLWKINHLPSLSSH